MNNPINIPEYTPEQINPFTREPSSKDEEVEYAPDYPKPEGMTTTVEGYWKGCTFVAFLQAKNSRGATVREAHIDHIEGYLGTDGFVKWLSDRVGDMEAKGLTDVFCTDCKVIPPFK